MRLPPRPRRRPAPPDRELAELAVAAVLLDVGCAAAVARAPHAAGAFGDGVSYRAMARGEAGAPPFNRRVLGPALARALSGGDAPGAFRAVALSATAADALATGLLAARIARQAGAEPARARRAGVLAGALVPLMPHTAQMAAQVPTFNDQLAAALGDAWLLAATSEAAPARALAPVAAALAALTREQWILVAGAVAARRASGRDRAAQLAALAAAAAVVAAQPASATIPGEVFPPAAALARLASVRGLGQLAWAVTFLGGALPLLLPAALGAARGARREPGRLPLAGLRLPPRPARAGRREPARRGPSPAPGGRRLPALPAALEVAALQAAAAVAGGSDAARILHGALPAFTAAVVGTAAAGADARLAPALAVTVAAWRPLARRPGTPRAYEDVSLPYLNGVLGRRLAEDAVLRALGLAAVVAWRRGGVARREPRALGLAAVVAWRRGGVARREWRALGLAPVVAWRRGGVARRDGLALPAVLGARWARVRAGTGR